MAANGPFADKQVLAEESPKRTFLQRLGACSLASFLLPSIIVTRENLFAALDQVELLADWVESQMGKVWE